MPRIKQLAFAILLVAIIVSTGLVIEYILPAHVNGGSLPGHIVRRLRGEMGPQQIVNDLSEDVQRVPQIQKWGVDMLLRFRAGKITIDKKSDSLPDFIPNVRLASTEWPEFLDKAWGETNSMEERPELLVLLSADGQPNCVAINWYDYGITVGPTNYVLSFEPDLSVKINPGVYAYSFNLK